MSTKPISNKYCFDMFEFSSSTSLNREISVAPMMGLTTRHFRYLARRISQRVLLYTEMITCGALIKGNDPERFLRFHPKEHPIALQLGGNDPKELAICAQIAESRGYDEVNLNVGCPSDKVKSGRMGACLMIEPSTVANVIKTMQNSVSIPVTVKHRIGIKSANCSLESYDDLAKFVEILANAGCQRFIVHARIAILDGLKPKANRSIPPLKYETVYKLKKDFPELSIVINGGIKSLDETKDHLNYVDGVMIGRAAYENPLMLKGVDAFLGQQEGISYDPTTSPTEILTSMKDYVISETQSGTPLHHITLHLLNLSRGISGAKKFRSYLSQNANRKASGWPVLEQAISFLSV